jgi:hypothetical protein
MLITCAPLMIQPAYMACMMHADSATARHRRCAYEKCVTSCNPQQVVTDARMERCSGGGASGGQNRIVQHKDHATDVSIASYRRTSAQKLESIETRPNRYLEMLVVEPKFVDRPGL